MLFALLFSSNIKMLAKYFVQRMRLNVVSPQRNTRKIIMVLAGKNKPKKASRAGE
jgi:hypothetical protein